MSALHRAQLPVAIVAGSLIIGAAIYLGLRERAPREVAVEAAPPSSNAARGGEATSTPAGGMRVEERVRVQAQAALDSLRPTLSQACWTPPGEGEPVAITLEYDVTFAADGGILALGIGEQREAHRAIVAQCVRGQPRPELRIDPPGMRVRAMLTLRLP
jgi:hypothetical protein